MEGEEEQVMAELKAVEKRKRRNEGLPPYFPPRGQILTFRLILRGKEGRNYAHPADAPARALRSEKGSPIVCKKGFTSGREEKQATNGSGRGCGAEEGGRLTITSSCSDEKKKERESDREPASVAERRGIRGKAGGSMRVLSAPVLQKKRESRRIRHEDGGKGGDQETDRLASS